MSRWLQNVGQFLEKLDDTAEKAAEEKNEENEDDLLLPGGEDNVANILAARGLATSAASPDKGEEEEEGALFPPDADGAAHQQDEEMDVVPPEDSVPLAEADEQEGDEQHHQEATKKDDETQISSTMMGAGTTGASAADDADIISSSTPAAVDAAQQIQATTPDDDAPGSDGVGSLEPTTTNNKSYESSNEEQQPVEVEAAQTEHHIVDEQQKDPPPPPPKAIDSVEEQNKEELESTMKEDPEKTEGKQKDQPEEAYSEPFYTPRQQQQLDPPPDDLAPAGSATTKEEDTEPPRPNIETPDRQEVKKEAPRLSMVGKLRATAAKAVEKAATAAVTSSVVVAAASSSSHAGAASAGSSASAAENDTSSNTNSSSSSHKVIAEAQKEVRTLRRHVVSLNKQLEAAESEIGAQRLELERAGERLSKDATRYKQECEKMKSLHSTEIQTLNSQHENTLKESQDRSGRQLQELRDQLRSLEQRRKDEGGDWNKELEDAIKREQEAIAKLASVEDEKDTLLSHISTLQAQQETLGSRLESLTETADNAIERERDADNRLDETLSAHARQISQRQARESELERTISELGAALVEARNSNKTGTNEGMEATGDSSQPQYGASGLDGELEALRAQLVDEQQRNTALQEELREISRERTEETSIAQTRQQKQDEKVAELSQNISRLKSELRDTQANSIRDSAKGDRKGDDEDMRRIKDLSEEVLRAREKVSNSSSEISALKSRLQVALDRAKKAESSLEEWMENGSRDTDDVESPAAGSGMRRRGGGRRVKGARTPTIRSALSLDTAHGEGAERIGKSLDALDNFLISGGKFMRYNPVARLLFISYLLLLHLWCGLLLFLHAHGFESIHGDFGAGGTLPHGPGSMMEAQQIQQLGLPQHQQGQQIADVKLDGSN